MRQVTVLAFPRVQPLDVTGPVEVFSIASRLARARPSGRAGAPAGYRVEVVAPTAGALRTWSGLGLMVDRDLAHATRPIDTLVVAGGPGVDAAVRDRTLVGWVRRTARRARRVASVCTGAFILAEAGLLDGRRATTHWSACDELARRYPRVRVERDPIFVREGAVSTSAGVTAGIDLALDLVDEDFGRGIALGVARWLVLFLRRPGGQSQFSAQLGGQVAERDALRDLQAFIADHPAEDLSVPSLARRTGMSTRNFARAFRRDLAQTPAVYVERARVEAARRRLEATGAGLAEIARDTGFGTVETMHRAFRRTLRVTPGAYRAHFRGAREA
jgi:transcriptional regulator GlxA family with amidase domain